MTVSVPCVVVPVEVTLGYGKFVSPIELVVLKKLTLPDGNSTDAAVYGAHELARSLGLGQRLTLDIISDLWHKNYITVDLSRGVVRATDHVRSQAAQQKLAALEGAEEQWAEYQLMVDCLTGTLMPVAGHTRPQEGHVVVPVPDDWGVADGFSHAELAEALHEHLRRERRSDRSGLQARERRVLTAQIVPAVRRPPLEQRWLPLSINVGWDHDAQRVRLFSEDGSFPTTSRLRVLSQIAGLVDESPESPFASQVRRAIDGQLVDTPSLETALSRFEHSAGTLAEAAQDTLGQRHRELAGQARQVTELLRMRVAAEVRTKVVVDPAGHHEAVTDLIESAREQLVLVCPQLGYERMHEIFEPLKRALLGGVRVIVLWGDSQRSELPKEVQNLLTDLRRQGRGNLVWSYRPSRTRACLMVCDDRAALVTGFPFLAQSPSRHGRAGRDRQNRARQLGLRIEAPTSEACEPIEALLHWSRTTVPDYLEGQRVRVRHGDFRLGHDGSAADRSEGAGAPWEPRVPELPVEPPPSADGAPLSKAVRLMWSQAWTEYAAALRRELRARSLPSAVVQIDGAHREALWQALRNTRTRLILSSARIGPDAFDSRTAAAIGRLLAADVEVTVAHGRQGDGTGVAEGPRRLLAELRAHDGGKNLKVTQQATNARVMVWDDEVLVGSFDLLSVGARAPGVPRRMPSEVGLRLVDPHAAAELARAVHGAAASEGAELSAEQRAADPEDEVQPTLSHAQRLVNEGAQVTPPGDPVALAALARSHLDGLLEHDSETAWSLLNALSENEAHHLLRPAAAHLITQQPDGSQARRWRRWLMRDLWEREEFTGATVLRAAIRGDDIRPRLPLVLAAAARGDAYFGEAVDRAALEINESLAAGRPWAVAEAAALACLCASEILVESQGDAAADALRFLEPDLAAPWSALSRLAREHAATGLGPIPTAELVALTDGKMHRRDVAAAWQELDRRHQRAAQVTFRFLSGTRTHAQLFRPDGDFGELRSILDRKDEEAVRQWLHTHPAGEADRILDRATRSVESTRELPLMMNNQRTNFVARLAEISEGAAALVGLLDAGGSADSGRLADFAPTARRLAELLPSAVAGADALDGPETVLARAMLRRLQHVANWGGSF
ncbi:hypothetical protein [Kitasatospora sp. NPDC088134]|uniref:hypothetical protein n=1 Tax=Kitasatospora sp. NPDC088134 TaxID=3364071 RepID=UPI00382A2D0D